jgi:hypothetical protein
MPGCATLIPIPFLLAGLLAVAFAAPEAADGRSTAALILALAGVAGVGIGAGMHFGFRRQAARQRRLAERQAHWPEEPWRWRENWADGPVTDTTRQQAIAAWFVAVLWNAVSLPSTVLAIREATRTGEPALYLVTIFGAIGIGLLAHATRQSLRHRRFGTSALELETFPGFLGGTLAGRLRASLDLHTSPRIPVTLRCLRTAGRGPTGAPVEEVLWESQLDVVRTFPDGPFTVIHFAFRLPDDLPPSAPLPAPAGIAWRLEARAEIPGVDYYAQFEVPVFAPPPGIVLPSGDLPIAALGFDDYIQPPGSRILVTTTQRGTEVWLPAARHLVPAVVVTTGAAFFGGLGVFLLWTDAPQVVGWALSLLGGAIALAAANLWFGTSRVLATAQGLEITHGFLGLGRTRRIPSGEIADLATRTVMQANARYYADLMVALRGGGQVALGRAIRERREAEWLADRLLRALGR